jgi:hypothetical protein
MFSLRLAACVQGKDFSRLAGYFGAASNADTGFAQK